LPLTPPPSSPGFWVFGYGSLMWRPGFAFLERRLAILRGYKRAFALRSVRYRGTPEKPGLVLGLDWDPNAACTGTAFRVCASEADAVRDYLTAREMVTRSYFEIAYPVTLLCPGEGQGQPVEALAYVLDRTHVQYAGGLSLDEQARIIATAEGPGGPNAEYLHNTVAHLRELGVADSDLESLDEQVRRLCGAQG
jgi:cation transport protein ChaC